MIMSMTGFGRGIAQSDNLKATVDIKSVNSKQIDLTMRVPSSMRELEVSLRNKVAKALERGKIELSVCIESLAAPASARINNEVAARYIDELRQSSNSLGIDEPQDWWRLLLRLPDVLQNRTEEFGEKELATVTEAADLAIEALQSFRRAEGEKLYLFFVDKIKEISALLEEIDPMEAERVPHIRQRLEEQLGRLESIEYDRGRLEQEMIFYLEKLDVTEEKTRLRSHLSYFMETLGGSDALPQEGGQGKKLGFIAQEMGREINTLGSKSNHAGMQKVVVRMKDALEQIKEQVLNVL
ncbi:MAG: YicC family protein [Bacteroides sp.]|nr:YicC family protein [Bacteroides sp.]